MIESVFSLIKVNRQGNQYPVFQIQPNWLNEIIGVSIIRIEEEAIVHFLNTINRIRNSQLPSDSNIGNPGINVVVNGDKLHISYYEDFGLDEVEIDVSAVFEMYEQHLKFIRAYKNMEIPGIISTSRPGEFEIVKK